MADEYPGMQWMKSKKAATHELFCDPVPTPQPACAIIARIR
jgi:hypothetical protein